MQKPPAIQPQQVGNALYRGVYGISAANLRARHVMADTPVVGKYVACMRNGAVVAWVRVKRLQGQACAQQW